MSESGMNLVVLGGRLVSEPQLRMLPANSRPVCFMRLACQAEEFDVIVLGAKARLLGCRLHQGHCVILRGSLQMESWEDGEGPEQEAVCVLAKHVCFSAARPVGARSYASGPRDAAPEINSSTSSAHATG
jgi:single-stranded DNA-binding protein